MKVMDIYLFANYSLSVVYTKAIILTHHKHAIRAESKIIKLSAPIAGLW